MVPFQAPSLNSPYSCHLILKSYNDKVSLSLGNLLCTLNPSPYCSRKFSQMSDLILPTWNVSTPLLSLTIADVCNGSAACKRLPFSPWTPLSLPLLASPIFSPLLDSPSSTLFPISSPLVWATVFKPYFQLRINQTQWCWTDCKECLKTTFFMLPGIKEFTIFTTL